MATFLRRIFTVVVLSFGIHLFVLTSLQLPLFDQAIAYSYALNTSLILSYFLALFFSKKRRGLLTVFAYFTLSIFKFGLFYVLFYLPYTSDGVVTKKELFTFFVPYFLTQTTAIFSLSQWMHKFE